MDNIELIKKEIETREVENKPKLIIIEGLTRSGKTTLAKELEATSETFIHIDVGDEFKKNGCSSPNIAPLISSQNKTYIIDEAAHCQASPFLNALKSHIDNKGAAIVMVQAKSELDLDSFNSACWLTLNREGLSH